MPPILPPSALKYSFHLNEVKAALDVRESIDPALFDHLSFVFICFTNRCGSNFLAETLASDQTFNLGAESYNSSEVIRVTSNQNIKTFRDYSIGISLHQAKQGRVVVKLGIEHLTLLYCAGAFDAMSRHAKYIFIERKDKVAQAISKCLAQATSSWTSYNASTIPPELVPFSASAVDWEIKDIVAQNLAFEEFFCVNNLSPFRVIYEDYVKSPELALEALGNFLGAANLKLNVENVHTQRQSGAVSRLWRERYAAAHQEAAIRAE